MKRYGPLTSPRDASAVSRIFVQHPQKTFATISARSGSPRPQLITSSARNSSDEGTFCRANVHDRLGGPWALGRIPSLPSPLLLLVFWTGLWSCHAYPVLHRQIYRARHTSRALCATSARSRARGSGRHLDRRGRCGGAEESRTRARTIRSPRP